MRLGDRRRCLNFIFSAPPMHRLSPTIGASVRILLFVFVMTGIGRGQSVILAWDFTGESSVVTSVSDTVRSGLNSSTLSRGAGASASTGGNSFRTQGFGNDGIALTNTDYFQFTISPTAGNKVSLSSISAAFNGTASFAASPGVTMAYAYSLDGTNFTLLSSFNKTGTTSTPISFDVSAQSALQNVTSSITMRFFASGQTTTGGWGFSSSASGVNGLEIAGTVTAIPEPSAYATLVGAGVLAGAWWRRRKAGA